MPNTLRVAQANLNLDPHYDADAPMTTVQTVQMRELCEKLGEPFDTSLNQKQAMARIRLLEDMVAD